MAGDMASEIKNGVRLSFSGVFLEIPGLCRVFLGNSGIFPGCSRFSRECRGYAGFFPGICWGFPWNGGIFPRNARVMPGFSWECEDYTWDFFPGNAGVMLDFSGFFFFQKYQAYAGVFLFVWFFSRVFFPVFMPAFSQEWRDFPGVF